MGRLGGKDSCQGDSGGPLWWDDPIKQVTLGHGRKYRYTYSFMYVVTTQPLVSSPCRPATRLAS